MNEQEQFWAGEFGDEYTERNARSTRSDLVFFSRALKQARRIHSVYEPGCGDGSNLAALSQLYELDRDAIAGLEINPAAAKLAALHGDVREGSLLEAQPHATADLVVTKGLLIHIAPDYLPQAMDHIHAAAVRYILLAEYYSPRFEPIPYRGHAAVLWRGPYVDLIMAMYQDLMVLDYGFAWRYDGAGPQDDLTWWLLGLPPAVGIEAEGGLPAPVREGKHE